VGTNAACAIATSGDPMTADIFGSTGVCPVATAEGPSGSGTPGSLGLATTAALVALSFVGALVLAWRERPAPTR
jgi:hypothetical protein